MAHPRTPGKTGQELSTIVEELNYKFSLDIPNPRISSPLETRGDSPRWRIYRGLKILHYNQKVNLEAVLGNFVDWVCPRNVSDTMSILSRRGQLPRRERNAYRDSRTIITRHEREERLAYLNKLIEDEMYLLGNGSLSSFRRNDENDILPSPPPPDALTDRPLKRRYSGQESEDEYQTAPNSPVKSAKTTGSSSMAESDEFQDMKTDEICEFVQDLSKSSSVAEPPKKPSKFVERLLAPDNTRRYDSPALTYDGPKYSFDATDTGPTSNILESRYDRQQTSFNSTVTFATEPVPEPESTFADSRADHTFNRESTISRYPSFNASFAEETRFSYEGEVIETLLEKGPFSFSLDKPLPGSIPLRYRYELERIGRAWGIELKKMLAGNSISHGYDEFWEWIEGHSQRNGKPIPEKPTRKAWEAASGMFRTNKHSEVVVLTGDLEWCNKSEEGILKLRLNPLKAERTCRFHRRFGSDRFMSLTIPAPSRPPDYLQQREKPALLRESIALWLTQNVHRCLGRTWRPFFVEEVKSKRKVRAEPKFRVEFFAIDGIDFDHSPRPSSTVVSPKHECADRHTEMSLSSLLEWHLPLESNSNQTNLKLFQRISLGLSKTFATVTLRPSQILRLPDHPEKPVMNDGCALMSRPLANLICDSLGISGNTPSCFQGRIAGAKGLWMVDTHQSCLSTGGNEIWIQISDSQLKIKPHPNEWDDPIDEEQLMFEVVKWSKPLHPVNLNTQLLSILDHGGQVKEYIAELARTGIQAVSRDFEEVISSDNSILCRSLAQKVRPTTDSASEVMPQNARRLERWTVDNTEAIIRFSEAGFKPRSFYPLRKRLGWCLSDLLKRYVDELRIEVPLSTYAFCIADPYGVLAENEVHFGFSTNWRDDQGQFEDNLLDGIDVLVGRLPAHLPSDIQRRRAVWKAELRHFKDVIVFPTTGEIPLADMLSGGDYDGDTPWICWDQNIVSQFQNSNPPSKNEAYPPEHYGLEKYSVPMHQIESLDEFLESSFTFNLRLSNLGRCTVEHERLSYDESINSKSAKELACLLSHLVDSRKGGVHLSEPAWQKYRKTISPRVREMPAYRSPERKHKPDNIIDYIRFQVTSHERKAVLTRLQKRFPEDENRQCRDDDLVKPYREARERAEMDKHRDKSLYEVLPEVWKEIDGQYKLWRGTHNSFSARALEAAEQAQKIQPPTTGRHPMIKVWRENRDAWLELMASYAYNEMPHSTFVIHAFGETLCQIKARTVPSRLVINEVLACYRINQKLIARVRTHGVYDEDEESETSGEYDGHEAIEAMLYGTTGFGGYYDPDDGRSVE